MNKNDVCEDNIAHYPIGLRTTTEVIQILEYRYITRTENILDSGKGVCKND